MMNHFLSSGHGFQQSTDADRYANRAASDYEGTILYVEDEAFVREGTAEVLCAAGYRVLVAKNAAEAADIFQACAEVDLLLTDIVLPGETGRVLAARLRGANPRLSVLYVTGYAEQMGMRLGAREACLAKPFSKDALLEQVRGMIASNERLLHRESETTLACAGV